MIILQKMYHSNLRNKTQINKCTGDSRVAQFVKNILDLEETEDTPEKMTCTGIQHWLILLKTFEC